MDLYLFVSAGKRWRLPTKTGVSFIWYWIALVTLTAGLNGTNSSHREPSIPLDKLAYATIQDDLYSG